MAFARFGWDGSDVYLYGGVTGPDFDDLSTHIIVCGGCLLLQGEDCGHPWGEYADFSSRDKLLAHLREHRAAGHIVPESAIERIMTEDWIT